jgi:hypothetical protein
VRDWGRDESANRGKSESPAPLLGKRLMIGRYPR